MNGALRRLHCSPAGRVAAAALAPGAAATIAIRPEDIRVAPDDAAARDAHAPPRHHRRAVLRRRPLRGAGALGGEHSIVLLLTRAREWREGERVRLGFPPELVSVWPA